ncbi:DUF4859 domain-containing protein [Arthrospiribacter ruber]|uniref:DUF4859 domain-containing protein n=1 Tax=Arthrospiribacter ruber TaxID=2487934 RepID=A0A951J5V7_9BACT|nr:DUF4859 domain-containing protein [Arthrospiribacter ruber]MBW3470461.1 DUF4859 domain-containing protein [Arthrospiribacter ruber]
MRKSNYSNVKERMYFLLCVILITFWSASCTDELPVPESELTEPNDLEIYIPKEFSDMDMSDDASTWSFKRSRQSDHFIVFWDKRYGENDPNSAEVPDFFRVDIDNLLEKAESYYALNVYDLEFAKKGIGESNLDKYKMMIFLYYEEEWMAYGAGYDDVIGALWISPATSKPVGHVIAHEIGHSFQYQVYCDLKGGSGFRYGFGGNGGNAFWEQTAQWQALQSYPEQIFTTHDFQVYIENYHRHLCHEWYRYASYFIHYYWAEKHGKEFIGKLWRMASEPEDPIQAYMRLNGISVEQFNDEIYEAASKNVTWDIEGLREYGTSRIGHQKFNFQTLEDGSHQVAYNFAPGTTGYNVIPLSLPETGSTVTASFTGLVNAPGYNTVEDASRAGWRYGYVALLENGQRVYGAMNQGVTGTVNFEVPQNCSKLWFVVTGAPNSYLPHPWDENESNDDQWPYKVKFTNTNINGMVDLPDGATPSDKTISIDVNFPVSETSYDGTTVSLDMTDLAEAFVMQPNEIISKFGESIQFFGVESNGTLNSTTTANGYGHWFDANGNICNWGNDAVVYSEFNETNFTFNIGQYPGHSQPGSTYTVSQALVYTYQPGQTVQATITFNITLD